jgi:hypothetical protein
MSNTIRHILDEYRTKSDTDRLAGDWDKVGEDIRKVYSKEKKYPLMSLYNSCIQDQYPTRIRLHNMNNYNRD